MVISVDYLIKECFERHLFVRESIVNKLSNLGDFFGGNWNHALKGQLPAVKQIQLLLFESLFLESKHISILASSWHFIDIVEIFLRFLLGIGFRIRFEFFVGWSYTAFTLLLLSILKSLLLFFQTRIWIECKDKSLIK